jgi:uncharacterized phage protein (TIGR01671 family)
MRQIKFRVWDSFYPYMKYGNIDVKAYLNNDGISRNGYMLQQYTGLKDKNSKEIYEGDILIFRPCYQESVGGQYGNAIFSVVFKDGAFRFGDEYAEQEAANYYEIIGNICENLPLIKTEV